MYNKERKTREMCKTHADLYKNSLAFLNFSTNSQMGFRNSIAFCLHPLLEKLPLYFFGAEESAWPSFRLD